MMLLAVGLNICLSHNAGTVMPDSMNFEVSGESVAPWPQSAKGPDSVLSAFNIPEWFFLAGLQVSTVVDNALAKTRGICGEARYQNQEIRIDLSYGLKSSVEQAFLHELVHWILFVMNEDELRNNERFVDLFAHLLYQFQQTSGLVIRR